jgi:superfamily II DNA or RNA helicase
MVREITPFEAYALTLKTYLDSFNQNELGPSTVALLEANGYTTYQYQLDAVQQALNIIENQGGVIIADVVGLGKTIIACAIANELNKRGIVICPPGLMGDKNKKSGWRMYLEQFKLLKWEVRSAGDLESTAEFVKRMDDIEVVIIDEVHRFRNQDTKSYEYLKNICRDKIVIMLTATPLNNRPGDMLSLLKLFITPKKSTITLQSNLDGMFRSYKSTFKKLSNIKKNHNSPDPDKRASAESDYESLFEESDLDMSKVKQRSSYLAAQIRNVIEPVTIRRNRLDLQNNPDYADEVKNLSTIADPIEWYFELTPEQSNFYDKIITTYFGHPDEGGQFKGAIYQPFIYETAKRKDLSAEENFEFQQQRNLFDFMRRLMVKRFESSFGAFQQSIRRFKRINREALAFIKKTGKYIMDRPLLEKIYELEEETIEAYLDEYAEELRRGDYPKNHRIYELKDFDYPDSFIDDIQSDLALFDRILDELKEMDLVKDDPKAKCLNFHVEQILDDEPIPGVPKRKVGEPKRKLVIFSEYADTISHLEKSLKPKFGKRVFVVTGNLSDNKIEEINANFDASYQDPVDDYDILLSTDRISEGYNLNRAGMVINYDIPWNPVRVIQRVGRINRISKKVFEDLYIVNFFPTEKGAPLVRSREIARDKMFLIHEVLGEDAKIFDVDETPSAAELFNRIRQNPEDIEQESFYTKVVNLYHEITKNYPQLAQDLADFPPRVKVAKAGQENELLVVFKKSRLYIQGIQYDAEDGSEPTALTFEEALPKIACSEDQEKLDLSPVFWDHYQEARQVKEPGYQPLSPQSIEKKAINNLKTLITRDYEKLKLYRDFIRMLLEDIMEYGTLPDFTLRRIANLETMNASKLKELEKDIKDLKRELGENYLQHHKIEETRLKPEIIIAIENQIT